MSRSQNIDIIDRLDEVRDLVTVANMAVSDIGEREAKSGLNRLLGIISSQLDAVVDKLNEEAEGGDDPARS